MQIPPHVKNNPNYTLLAHYFEPEEVVRIVESHIPINRPGVVPSLQVPPGAKDCDQIPVMNIDGMGRVFDPRTAMGTLGNTAITDMPPDINVGGYQGWIPLQLSQDIISLFPGSYGTTSQSTPSQMPNPPDTALAWVNDNWLLIAGSLVGLLALSTMTKR